MTSLYAPTRKAKTMGAEKGWAIKFARLTKHIILSMLMPYIHNMIALLFGNQAKES